MSATATVATTATTISWQLDPAHTVIEFAVRHLMIAKVKGRFTGVRGVIVEGPTGLDVDVEIEAASIDTREAQRDAHLRSPDFLNVELYPTLTYGSRRFERLAAGRYRVWGDLTIRGVTREVVLDVREGGRGKDPWGNERVGFTATATIRRRDFGLEWNVALETGGVLVGDEVEILIDGEAVKQS